MIKHLLGAGALSLAFFSASAAAQTCDRTCLIKLSDNYIAALVAHDPKQAPLAADVVTVENVKRIKPGEGLWTSLAAGPDSFVIHVPDPVSQQVGVLALAKSSDGKPDDIAVRADVEIPERKLKMTMSFRRNTDSSLPASHTAELTFILPPDYDAGTVANVPGILMKSNEQARGTPLAGLAVKVTDGFFLIGLSNVEADRARNLQLLKERSWFDIPLVYSNQRRAIIAIEKGAPGERAFNAAFMAWGE